MIKKTTLLKFLLRQIFLLSLLSSSIVYAQTGPSDDFDGDGVINSIDIDDDNDGVPDATESPNCYYTASEIAIPASVTTTVANSGTIANLYDNNPATLFNFTNGTTKVNLTVFEVTPIRPVAAAGLQIEMNFYGQTEFSNTAASLTLEGWNGTAWVTLMPAFNPSTAPNTAQGFYQTFNFTQNQNTAYSKFRLQGLAGTIVGSQIREVKMLMPNNYIASLYPKTSCTDANIDGDNILPHFDLDSDGDGYSDALEAGATTNTASNYQFPDVDANNDGLVDAVDADNNGYVNYNSTYFEYALNKNISATADSDGDGIADGVDLDDDNDGIPDTVECGSGIQTIEGGVKNLTETLPSGLNASNALYSQYGLIIRERSKVAPYNIVRDNFNIVSHSGDADNEYIFFADAVSYSFEYYNPFTNQKRLVDRIQVSAEPATDGSILTLTCFDDAGTVIYTGTFPDGSTMSVDTTQTLNNSKIHRFIVSGSNNTTGFDQVFVQGMSIFAGSCDTDGDAVPNHLDLDSDGDGCSDLAESGVSPVTDVSTPTSITNNNGTSYGIAADKLAGSQLNPNGTDTNNNGLNDSVENGTTGTVSYPSTYNPYAIGSNYAACADTDGDGILDINDIDDDNDGVLDAVESPGCFYTAAEAGTIATVSTPLPNDDGVNVNLPFIHDGVITSVIASNNVIAVNQSVNGSIIYNIEYPTAVKLTSISHYGTTFGTNATAKIQGSNDKIIWDELMTAATAATATNPRTFTVNNNTANSYRYYRIVKVAGTDTPAITTYEVSGVQNTAGYNPSAHPKPTCTNDPDGDGIPNHRDLDSDGDGCSDSVEGGNTVFTANNTTTYNTGADANNNGLLNQFESATTPGTINYTSTYTLYAADAAVSACLDSDGDGIPDIVDIDDDNDGILDKTEQICPSENAGYNTDSSSGINNMFDYYGLANFAFLYDQLADNIGVIFSTNSSFAAGTGIQLSNGACGELALWGGGYGNDIWIKSVNPANISQPVPLNSITLKTDCGALPNEYSTYEAYGINGNLLYTHNINSLQQNNYVFDVVMDPAYDVYSIKISRSNNAAVVSGVTLKDGNGFFMCDPNTDTDGDGVPNHLDLDSDGDGCPDAVEAGTATQAGAGNTSAGTLVNTSGTQTGVANAIVGNNTPAAYGTNGFYSGIETNDTSSAAYTGIYSYNQYAIVSTLNLCTDTDGDGIIDLNDIDDDNDGIVDAVESPACFYTAAEANVISKITSQFTSPDDDQTDGDIQLLHDGATALTFNFNPFLATANPTGSNLFTIEYPTSLQLATLSVSQRISAMANANAVVVGSNDGVTWSAALSPATLITATPTVFNITTTQPYKYYRIQTGSVPGALAATNTIGEITSTVAASYIPSAHQKPVICSVDTDGDTIPNHLDLDSDGDGCSDLAESGVSPATDIITPLLTNNAGGSYGIANPNGSQLNPTAADVNNDGLNDSVDADLNSITNYTSTYSNAINAAIASCTLFCYRPAVLSGTVLSTPQGITSLHRAGVDADNWPMVRKGAWTALEAKTKGFVPNRLTIAQINLIPAGDLREGMMVYNISSDCLYINTDGTPTGWKCFNTQACPD